MYQDHLHKITQDSENQRQRRDEIIKNFQTKLSNSEGELQKTRAKHAADEYVLGVLCNNTWMACVLRFSFKAAVDVGKWFTDSI